MSVLVTLKFPVKASEVDNLLKVLKEALVDTRAYDGCQSVSVYLVEHWDSAENQEDYMRWRTATGLIEAMEPLLAGEIDVQTYDPAGDI